MKPKFEIVKNFKIFGIVAILFVIVGLAGLILLPFGVNLFNFGVDFVGGTTMHIALHTQVGDAEVAKVEQIVEEVTSKPASSVVRTGDGTEVQISTLDIPTETRDEIFEQLKAEYNLSDSDRLNVENVSASVGKDLQLAAVFSAFLAIVLMLAYITIRFEFKSGLAAVCTLTHDLLVMLSVYIIFRIPMDMNFIAAALTILGYSINASIIVFDRVRENRRFSGKASFDEVVEQSIWQTLMRTVNTTLTTLFPIVMLYIFGVSSIKNFALPLIVGVVAGGYSSAFLAGPLWTKFRKLGRKKAA